MTKQQNRLGPIFFAGPQMTLGKVYECSEVKKNCLQKKNYFCKTLKIHGFLGSRPISRVKVDNTNYNQHFIKHDDDNNSQF